jgi:hypothetical protein
MSEEKKSVMNLKSNHRFSSLIFMIVALVYIFSHIGGDKLFTLFIKDYNDKKHFGRYFLESNTDVYNTFYNSNYDKFQADFGIYTEALKTGFRISTKRAWSFIKNMDEFKVKGSFSKEKYDKFLQDKKIPESTVIKYAEIALTRQYIGKSCYLLSIKNDELLIGLMEKLGFYTIKGTSYIINDKYDIEVTNEQVEDFIKSRQKDEAGIYKTADQISGEVILIPKNAIKMSDKTVGEIKYLSLEELKKYCNSEDVLSFKIDDAVGGFSYLRQVLFEPNEFQVLKKNFLNLDPLVKDSLKYDEYYVIKKVSSIKPSENANVDFDRAKDELLSLLSLEKNKAKAIEIAGKINNGEKVELKNGEERIFNFDLSNLKSIEKLETNDFNVDILLAQKGKTCVVYTSHGFMVFVCDDVVFNKTKVDSATALTIKTIQDFRDVLRGVVVYTIVNKERDL